MFAKKVVALVVLSLGLLLPGLSMAGEPGREPAQVEQPAPGERELFSRLIAPCCWNQTLDIHGGDAPDRLRAELRARLLAGESIESIEADMVARYGERVRAASRSSQLAVSSLVVVGVALVSLVAVGLMLRRWARASARTVSSGKPDKKTDAAEDAALEARLDAELRALD